MLNFSIHIHAIAGNTYRDLINDAATLADSLDCMVEFDFNELPVYILPGDDVNEKCQELAERISKRAAKAEKRRLKEMR